MKQSERYAFIDLVARELQWRFKTYELDAYLNSMGVNTPDSAVGTSSKWVYAKGVLSGVPESILTAIAEDLELDLPNSNAAIANPPSVWSGTKQFKLFISHISPHKRMATKLRDHLAPYGITGFVAHEDIEPTKLWESELRNALRTMDALVSMHTPGFRESNWTQQEIGFAVGRGKKIIAFHMGEDPTGFLSQEQALLHNRRTADVIAKEIDKLLSEDGRTKSKLLDAKRSMLPPSLDDEIPF